MAVGTEENCRPLQARSQMQEALPSWTGEMPPLGHRLELPLPPIGAVAAAGSPSGCRRSHRLEPPLPL
nr:unnamed protein product [Digitaria exilis]